MSRHFVVSSPRFLLLLLPLACQKPLPQKVTLGDVNHTETEVTGQATWGAGVHTFTEQTITIKGDVTAEGCAVIKLMKPGATIVVADGGSLKWEGTADCHIKVTSAKDAPAAGDWAGIEFESTAAKPKCSFDYVDIEYAGANAAQGVILLGVDAGLTMKHTTVTSSMGPALFVSAGARLTDFHGNSVENVVIAADSVRDLAADNTITGTISVRNTIVSTTATWQKFDAPYVLDNGLSVESTSGSAILTLGTGVTVKLAAAQSIELNGNGGLVLDGAKITSAKSPPAAGDWGYIEVNQASVNAANSFKNAVIEYGGGQGYGAVWLEDGASLEMTNTHVEHSGHMGVQANLNSRLRNFTGNTIANNALQPIEIAADHVDDIGAGTYEKTISVLYDSVEHDATWKDRGVPYVVAAGMTIGSTNPATLTIEKGVTLQVGPAQSIDVNANGRLVTGVGGTGRVKITTSKSAKAPGDWAEINLNGGNNNFTATDIEYGGGSGAGSIYMDDSASLTWSDVNFVMSSTCDITYDAATVTPATGFVKCP